jgi:hypothetical protein
MPPLMTDERGAPRHAQCDIGAYETQPPSVVSAPALLGPATVGAPLVCPTSGFAGDSPLSFAFAWLQGGTAIPAATSASYTPSPADLGKTVSCSVVATNAYGSAAATSNALTVQSAGVFAGILLRSKKLTADGHGHVSMSLFCPASTPGGRCSVEVSLYAKTGVLPTSATGVPKKAKGPREAALLARAGLSVAAGHAKSARLKLTEAGRRVTSHLPVQVRVLLTSRDTAGDMVSRSARATVLRARRGHAHH